MKNIADMTPAEIADEIDWMEENFQRCEEIGQGISSKENIRHARLKAAQVMTGTKPGLLTPQQIAILRSEYSRIETIDPCAPTYQSLCATLDAMPDELLKQVEGADIKFMSMLARNRCIRRGI